MFINVLTNENINFQINRCVRVYTYTHRFLTIIKSQIVNHR